MRWHKPNKGRASILFALLAIQACNSSEDTNTPVNEARQAIKGHYVYGHEESSFQPCGQNKTFWVNGSIKHLTMPEQKYKSLTSKPYEPVFAGLRGQFTGKASDGFAMDYDGQFQLTAIIRVKKKSTGDCQ